MKYRTVLACHYCEADDLPAFFCMECGVPKCEECTARFEGWEGLCVECFQNSSNPDSSGCIARIVLEMAGGGRRVVYVGGENIQGAVQEALRLIQKSTLESRKSTVLIRID